jgi:hypothetical protein
MDSYNLAMTCIWIVLGLVMAGTIPGLSMARTWIVLGLAKTLDLKKKKFLARLRINKGIGARESAYFHHN